MLQNSFETILPVIFFASVTLAILVYGTLYNASAYYKYPILTKSIGYLAIQSLLITLFLIINNPQTGSVSTVVFNNVLIIDDFTTFIGTLIILGALATIFMSFNFTLNQRMSARINEYMVLILFSTLSMLLLVSSFDLLSMYLAIELQSLSFYVLAAYQRNNEFSTEAGLKYFILGSLASGLLLFGESLIYGFTGLTNFEELSKLIAVIPETTQPLAAWPTYIGTMIGVFFILIAFLFKISAVPFHLWTPDVYEGAPTTVTAFFSITPKIAIVGLLLRLCMYTFYDLIEAWEYLIIGCAFLSMFIGTLGAINQNKIKRLLAYSSIAHVGYLLISLATGTIESIEALLIYVVLYMVTISNAFGVLLVMARENIETYDLNQNKDCPPSINYQPTKKYLYWNYLKQGHSYIINDQNIDQEKSFTNKQSNQNNISLISYACLIQGNPTWDLRSYNGTNIKQENQKIYKPIIIGTKKKEITYIKHITDFSTLAKTNPILALTAAIMFFSNAGIPPLAGFYGKLNVFLTAVENNMYFLAISGILCSVIGTFYSIRLVKIIYFHSMSNKTWNFYQTISKENAIILAITFFFTWFFCLTPSLLFITAHSAAISLCA